MNLITEMLKALESIDDCARMNVGVEPIGPYGVLKDGIGQLHQQLAEYEAYVRSLEKSAEDAGIMRMLQIYALEEALEEKLAEKDAEIERLKEQYTLFAGNGYRMRDDLAARELTIKQMREALKCAYETAGAHDETMPFDWAVYCEMLYQALSLQPSQENLDAYVAEWKRDAERLDYLSGEYIKVDPITIRAGFDDSDVGWRLSQYHMGKPSEVVVHEHYDDDLRAAIDNTIDKESK